MMRMNFERILGKITEGAVIEQPLSKAPGRYVWDVDG